jgi:endonuclease/exonuclease/phosphatase (EEP) superfamily protein YafD
MDDEHPIWTAVLKTALVLAILGLAAGYLGWLHPLGDLLAVGRAHAAATVAILALLSIRVGLRLAPFGALMLALIVGVQVALAHLWPGPPGTFKLYQKNMLYRNAELSALEADIRAAAPLAVTLQEVSPQNVAMLDALADVYPHRLHCTTGRRGGTAVITSLTPVPGSETCADGLAALQVEWRESRVWLVSIHLEWPWPHDQAAQARALRPVLARLEGPVLIGGDFNMVRWGASVEGLAQSARAVAAGPSKGTFLGFSTWFALPIDHAFAPNGGRVRYRAALGSDHLGLLAELEP